MDAAVAVAGVAMGAMAAAMAATGMPSRAWQRLLSRAFLNLRLPLHAPPNHGERSSSDRPQDTSR